jgi:hypothetical protein
MAGIEDENGGIMHQAQQRRAQDMSGFYMTTHRRGLARRLQSLDAMTALVGTVALCMIGLLRAFAEAHT